jgi:hypothetical protein
LQTQLARAIKIEEIKDDTNARQIGWQFRVVEIVIVLNAQ